MKLHGFTRIAGLIFLVAVLALSIAACGEEEEEVDVDQIIEEATEQMAGGGEEINACAIVTQQDASDLFGGEAEQDESTAPLVAGECIWSQDTDMASQLLQFRVWDGEQFYFDDPEAEQLDLGDKGWMSVDDFAGIDIMWIQDGKTIDLSYFNVGEGMPTIDSKVEEMKALAQQVSDKL